MLASASPRRKELLAQIGLEPEIRPSRMEEETREKKPDMVVMEPVSYTHLWYPVWQRGTA